MKCTQGRKSIYALVASSLLASCASQTPPRAPAIPPHAVLGVQQQQLTPSFWISRESNASKIVLDARAIAAQNARLLELDPSVNNLYAMPPELTAGKVRSWIEKLSGYPEKDMFDGEGFVRGVQRKGLQLDGARVLVVGSGGVGSAIAASLAAAGIGAISLYDMNIASCEGLGARLRRPTPWLAR